MADKDKDKDKGKGKEKEKPTGQDAEKYTQDGDIATWRRTRCFVLLMLFLGMANAYVMRTNMSVAIVAMVKRNTGEGEFDWSYKLQGYILSSFFYGYVITQIPFGFLIKYYGAKHFLGWGMMINSVAAFLVPISARAGGYIGLCCVRFIQGLGEGPIVPCSHALLAHWTPPAERSRAGAIVYAGAQFGTIISMPLSGLLAEHGFDGGWPSIFYVFGAVSTVWCIFFLWLVAENPEKSSRISAAERQYILDSIWKAQPEDAAGPMPYLKIIRAMPFYAILVAHAGQNYGYETLMTMLPTYMDTVLKVNIRENGFVSALPYVAMWLLAMVFGFVADCLIKRSFSVTITRKMMNSIGQYGPALALIAVSFVHHNLILTCGVFVLGLGLNGAIYSGFKINHLDISPRYAGLLIAITNCCANLVGLTAPMVAGHVIHNGPTVENWRIVFYISAGVFIFCATFYNIFATGKFLW
ncbi:uncharacterized protein Dana_GF20342 [Drosophila ananassae]|uniref:Putative inorganic phosphate cotransporter n=1 Tax=Drosophila ananassae TaxID=7217 RepID=B3MPY5_DROAN|nr:putative inorganic phosphate cotransporter [Drosophila ananassae]EDV44411.1 uncharacterized protein Dana_GF20342 [Drosophila ananassae]